MDQENIGFTLSGTQTAHVHPLICTEIAQMLIWLLCLVAADLYSYQ